MGTEFHAHSGWYFNRRDDGSVAVEKRGFTVNPASEDDPDPQPEVYVAAAVIFDANTWASIVASVSANGENADTYDDARRFHLMQRGRTYSWPGERRDVYPRPLPEGLSPDYDEGAL